MINLFKNTDGLDFLVKFSKKLREDNVTAIGAQLSYYLLISIFPFVIFLLNIVSFLPITKDFLVNELLINLPYDIKLMVLDLIKETFASSNETLLSFSIITGLWAASKGALAFIRVMNRAYGVEENRNYILVRLLSIIYTLAIFLSFVLVLMTLVFGEILGNKIFSYLGLSHFFSMTWTYLRKFISLLAMVVIFGILFRYGPAKINGQRPSLKETLPGAVFSSLGWIISSLAFAFYVNNFGNFSKTYGSLAGIVVLLLWLYMSSVLIIIGAELNAIFEEIRLEEL